MKKTEAAAELMRAEIEGKDILEAACGCAEFSCAASRYAHSVACMDLTAGRIRQALPENVHFKIGDAAAMSYPDEAFDAVFLYNAFAHILPQWEDIEKECRRVLKPGGSIHILATWGLDKQPLCERYGDAVRQQQGDLLLVTLPK